MLGLAAAGSLLLAGCGSSSTPDAPAASTPGATASSAAPSASSATTAPWGGQVPASCAAIPRSVIAPYVGAAVSVTRQIAATSHSVSGEFLSSPTAVLILNIGAGGTSAGFGAFQHSSGHGGRTTAAVAGLGSSAFSIDKGVPGGMAVISSSGVTFAVTSNDSFAQDEALIRQLMALC